MTLIGDKQDGSNHQRQPEHHTFTVHANLSGFKINCFPFHQLFGPKHCSRKKTSLNDQTESFALRWMYFLTIWLLALLCPASSAAVAAATSIAASQPSLLDIVAAPAIINKNPAFLPALLPVTILFEEHHHFELTELVKEAVGIDPPPAALAQSHSHGRSLGTDWCGNGKPATGVHSLPRGTTCTLTAHVTLATST